ncbi:MAG: AbrB/MazE/SpoVT family DNA-binding domain-containing protein [Candidatus Aenigmatarchaeota archaeon]
MSELEGRIKKWGNSFGVIIPNEIIRKENLKDGQKVEIILRKPSKINMNKVFGSLKDWKKPTSRILKVVDKELWND